MQTVVGIRGPVRTPRLTLSLAGPEPTNELTLIENGGLEVKKKTKMEKRVSFTTTGSYHFFLLLSCLECCAFL